MFEPAIGRAKVFAITVGYTHSEQADHTRLERIGPYFQVPSSVSPSQLGHLYSPSIMLCRLTKVITLGFREIPSLLSL